MFWDKEKQYLSSLKNQRIIKEIKVKTIKQISHKLTFKPGFKRQNNTR